MPCALRMMVESHQSAATLYVTGELTTASVLEASACLEQLPNGVRALCVDLCGARRTEQDALGALEFALHSWRAARYGMTRVKLGPDAETNLIAIKFAHQRWRGAESAQAAHPRGRFGLRMRDHSEAVVTRSLRERAGSETR